MALRELVDGDCGAPSSVMHLTSHFIQDHGFKEEGIHHPFKVDEQLPIIDSDQLVNKFLEEKSCPQTFRMDSIIQEMREIDHNIHPFIPKPGVVEELAISDTAWANQYLESGKHFQVRSLRIYKSRIIIKRNVSFNFGNSGTSQG